MEHPADAHVLRLFFYKHATARLTRMRAYCVALCVSISCTPQSRHLQLQLLQQQVQSLGRRQTRTPNQPPATCKYSCSGSSHGCARGCWPRSPIKLPTTHYSCWNRSLPRLSFKRDACRYLGAPAPKTIAAHLALHIKTLKNIYITKHLPTTHSARGAGHALAATTLLPTAATASTTAAQQRQPPAASSAHAHCRHRGTLLLLPAVVYKAPLQGRVCVFLFGIASVGASIVLFVRSIARSMRGIPVQNTGSTDLHSSQPT